jgi:hypothetical protein
MWRTRFGRGFGPVIRQTTNGDDDVLIFIMYKQCVKLKKNGMSLQEFFRRSFFSQVLKHQLNSKEM